jgi:Glyoxalase/Bleomycin resistance protein/Dioxygenase superfamily
MGSSDAMTGISAALSPNRWGLAFHHLGLATMDPKAASQFLTGLGYQIGPTIFDPLQNVHLAMCAHGEMPDVEIISPAEGSGPLDKLLATHGNGLIYHMCYTAADLDKSLDAIESEVGIRLVSPPKRAVLFGGKQVSFYLIEDVGLIEIIEDGP